jgi:dTDP-glucose pyrophosphorylase
LARRSVENDQFLVHAGDTVVTAPFTIREVLEECDSYPHNNISCICVRKIDDKRLLKRYGVASVNAKSHVTKLVEKPTDPKSGFAVIPIYFLTQRIFDIIKILPHDKSNEVQLTNAINHLIKSKQTVLAYLLKEDIRRIDVGSPDTYFDALSSIII